MRHFCIAGLCLAITTNVAASTAEETVAYDETIIEEVTVVGKQPGPKLWRVINGENTLWILGTLSPLPRDMEWDSQSVEAVLADAEEVIYPPGISLSAGTLKGIFALPLLWGLRNNPDKKKLQEILPAELYERWLVLKHRYIGSGQKIEKRRPIIAAYELYAEALKKSGLGAGGMVFRVVSKSTKRHTIPITETGVTGKIEDPRRAIKDFKRSSVDDIECFETIVERLEVDLAVMRSRAVAWASGDVAALRVLPYVDQDKSCINAITNSAFGSDLIESAGLTNFEETMRSNWLTAAEKALKNNAVSFAVLPISEILEPDGYVSLLSKKGYEIRGG